MLILANFENMKCSHFNKWFSGLLAGILMVLISSSCAINSKGVAEPEYYTVREVIDGDTFWINDGSGK